MKIYMKYAEDVGYMSIIEAVVDVNNTFLSRRELTCNFAGLGGKLKKNEAVDMVTKEFKLDGKVVIPMRLKTHVGKPTITGTFYVYDDEGLAKKHIDPTIFSRMDRVKVKEADAQKTDEEPIKEEAGGDESVKETKAPEESKEKILVEKAEAPTEEPKVEKSE